MGNERFSKPEMDVRARRRLRPCMCCKAEFPSEGPHNRLCDPCRSQGETYAGVAALATARVRRAAQV